MSIRWRNLFDELRIPWRDRGPNTSRGHINIRCCWCGTADPSFHLGIEEETGAYFCFRSTKHGGRSPYFLLLALGVEHDSIDLLLRTHGGGGPLPQRAPKAPPIAATAAMRRWQIFTPAARNNEALEYLGKRGFRNPGTTAQVFDLRVGTGRWAGRVWMPFIKDEQVIGFVGRSMRGATTPYVSESSDNVLYLPQQLVSQYALLLVEGPMDALKLADAVRNRYNIFVAALCGLALTPTKRLQLLELSRIIPKFYIVMDNTVPVSNVNRLMAELRPLPLRTLIRGPLPKGTDDPGEMRDEEIWAWLNTMELAA